MKVVSNTTPIISLASIGKRGILKELFNEILIAETVYNEIKAKNSYGYEEVELDISDDFDAPLPDEFWLGESDKLNF